MADTNPIPALLKFESKFPGFPSPVPIEDAHLGFLNRQRVKPLCQRCSVLDFSAMVHPTYCEIDQLADGQSDEAQRFRQIETRYIFIRRASYIQETANECRLCEILWDILRKSNRGEEPSIELNGQPTICGLRVESFASVQLPDGDERTTWNLPRLSIALAPHQEPNALVVSDGIRDIFPNAVVKSMFCLQTSHGRHPRVQELWPFTTSLPPSRLQRKLPAYSGRVRPLKVDIQLVKRWIQLCSSEHGRSCPLANNLDIGTIRLINVRKMCVQRIPQPGKERYVALSYVWGDDDDQEVKLTHSNADELAKEDALRHLTLPKTVRDAIQLTKELGFDYLWIDAFCVFQDEAPPNFELPDTLGLPRSLIECLSIPRDQDAEKWEQLGKMDKIYGGAFMTLIAAAGDSVHAGLPGYSGHTRCQLQDQVFVGRKVRENGQEDTSLRVRDILLMANLRPQALAQDHFLDGTKWNTRCWTFQERVLSKRCLIFTEEQVYWECKGGSFCEESQYDFGVQPVVRHSQEPSLLPESAQAPEDLTGTTKRWTYESMSSHFWYLILRYTLRNLKKEKDYLHALTGVLNALTRSWGEEFFWGLPRTTFEHQLLWSGGDGGQRIAFHVSMDYTGVIWSLPFPTWSWLAWKEHVWLPVSDGTHFYLAKFPGNPKVPYKDQYDHHRAEIICYTFDPEALSYDKSSGTWTIGNSIKPMYDIRTTQPAWLDNVPRPQLSPSVWRPFSNYELTWGPGFQLVEERSDTVPIPLNVAFEVTTDMALLQLDIDTREGVKFKMGLGDGPQTLIFFWASSARFKVSWKLARQSEQFLYDHNDPRKRFGWHMCPAILDDEDQPVGYLNPMHEWFYEKRGLHKGKMELIVIASYLDKKDSSRKLDVMLIKWHGLVAKRVTIGQIDEEVWAKADRTWKLINCSRIRA